MDTSYTFNKKGWKVEFITGDNITIYKNKKTGEKRFAFGNTSWGTIQEARNSLKGKAANLIHSANQRNVLIEFIKGGFDTPSEHLRYAMDDKGATIRFDTVFDARKWCKDNGYEVLQSQVPRKPLHVESDVDFIPSLEQIIAEAEQGLKAGAKEIEDLRNELAKKTEAHEGMYAGMKCMKEDHEELLRRKEENNG